jgi:hypothetical protein
MIKTYSLKQDGNVYLAPDFQAREFACHDGTDKILVSDVLVMNLQKIRDHYKRPVKVSSGYRTAAYNTKIAGAKGSHHIAGEAADIRMEGVSSLEVCMYAQSLGVPYLGWYAYDDGTQFSHIDVHSPGAACWKQRSAASGRSPLSTFLPVLKREFGVYTRHDFVLVLQKQLALAGYTVILDGKFGRATQGALKGFQIEHGLVPDGIADILTWRAIL